MHYIITWLDSVQDGKKNHRPIVCSLKRSDKYYKIKYTAGNIWGYIGSTPYIFKRGSRKDKLSYDVWVSAVNLKLGMMKALWFALTFSSVFFMTVDLGEWVNIFNLTSLLSMYHSSKETAPYF